MMKARKCIFLVLLALAGHASLAAKLTVKQDGTGNFTQIQDAINASTDGDTVLVWPGTYYENINFAGKNITLASLMLTTGDPAYRHITIIDGQYSGSCVNVMSGETDATLYGLSLQHGSGETWGGTSTTYGGGLNIAYARCSVEFCIISENFSDGAGGGISIVFSEGNRLIGTSIYNNHTFGAGGGMAIGYGGEVYFDSLERCNIFENYASMGCDIHKVYDSIFYVYLDTGTVLNPDSYFFSSIQEEGYQVDGIVHSIWNATITPKDTDIYVNPQLGNNRNNGLSPDAPLKTIAFAYSSLIVDNDDKNTIHLANGTYSDSANQEKFPLNIRPNINLVGQSRNMTILDGIYKSSIFKGNNEVSGYTLRNMTLQRGGRILSNQLWAPAGFAFLYAQNDNIHLDSILFYQGLGYSGSSQLGIEASNNVLVSNCEFYGNIGAYAIRTGQQGDTIRIRNCIFRENKPDSTQQWAWGGALSLISFETDTYVENCLFTGNNNYNVGASASFTDQGKHYFINCTFTENTNQSHFSSLSTLDANTYLYNCIFFDEGNPQPVTLSWQEAIDTIALEIFHTLIENGATGVFIEPGGPTRLNYAESNIPGNPLFDSLSSFPYSLSAGSPCIDAGTPVWLAGNDYPYVMQEDSLLLLYINENKVIELGSVDLAGNPRIWNNAMDMGAYEHGPWVITDEIKGDISAENQLFVYPNPFSGRLGIAYNTIEAGRVEIDVYDASGRYVACLLDSKQPGGKGAFVWNTAGHGPNILNPGTYLISLKIDGRKVCSQKAVKR